MFYITAIILGIVIIAFELCREKVDGVLDFLRATSIIYFIAFVLTPIYLKIISSHNIGVKKWGWVFINNFNDPIYVYAELMALLGYFSIIIGFILSKNFLNYFFLPSKENVISNLYLDSSSGRSMMLMLGVLTGILGLLSFYIYTKSLGGFFEMIKYSGAFRSQIANPSNVAFLKNISPFIIISSYFFYAAIKYKNDNKKAIFDIALFLLAYIISVILLYHMAGRLNIISYILIFPIISMIIRGKFNFRLIIFGLPIFLSFVYLGKDLFHYFMDPSSISNKINRMETGNYSFFTQLFFEFAFPIVNLANSIGYIVPDVIGYRYFTDFWLAVGSLIPQRIFDIDLPETVSMLNSMNYASNATVPVDLLTFGYYCAGAIGVILVTFSFGIVLRICDIILPYNQDKSTIVFRTAWIIFLSFRIMYGDPSITLKGGFCLLVSTFIYLYFRRRYIKVERVVLKSAEG